MTDPTMARIEDHLRRIADALEATSRDSRQVDLTAPSDDDLGEYPALRCAVYGSAAASHWDGCERPAGPLDESDHRARHDGKGWHWTWCGTGWTAGEGYVLADLLEIEANLGPVSFCDCPC